jgi:hypothetical protein
MSGLKPRGKRRPITDRRGIPGNDIADEPRRRPFAEARVVR